MSKREACRLPHVARSTTSYEGTHEVKDAAVIDKMAELAKQNPRDGYRRLRSPLKRVGQVMRPRRAHRLWAKAELQVPKKERRRIPTRTTRPTPRTGSNHVGCYDFVFDLCATGQPLRLRTIVDEHTREVLAIDVAGSIRSERVIEQLAKLITGHGPPAFQRTDNDPELVAQALVGWLEGEGVATARIEPGKPWQNGLNESINGKLRDEYLDMAWLRTGARPPSSSTPSGGTTSKCTPTRASSTERPWSSRSCSRTAPRPRLQRTTPRRPRDLDGDDDAPQTVAGSPSVVDAEDHRGV